MNLELSVDNAIRQANRHRQEHCCPCTCTGTTFATGTPPAGWQQQMKALAARYGYGFERNYKPAEISGSGCNGMTIGLPTTYRQAAELQMLGIKGHTIYYRPEETMAQEFSVAAHELSHALLGHPDQGEADEFEHEMPVRLASIAVCEAQGLVTGQFNICQMVQRMNRFGKNIRADHRSDALAAARVIGQALNSRRYVAA